jgi:hypothetical protein
LGRLADNPLHLDGIAPAESLFYWRFGMEATPFF